MQELLSTNTKRHGTNSISIIRACLAFFLGGICSSIRFTCLTAFIPMGLILAYTSYATIKLRILYLFGVCALFGLSGLLSTFVLDRIMYGFWAIPILGNFHFNVIQGTVNILNSRSTITHGNGSNLVFIFLTFVVVAFYGMKS